MSMLHFFHTLPSFFGYSTESTPNCTSTPTNKQRRYILNTLYSSSIGITINVIKEARRRALKTSSEVGLEDNSCIIESIDEYRNPVNIIIEKEKIEIALKAFEMISEDYKTVIRLRLINGMKAEDVAQLVGKSSTAVNSLFYRAIKALKKNFQEIYN